MKLSFPPLCTLRTSKFLRFLTTSSHNPPPPPATGHALLTTRRLVALTGHDASHFLQGLTTANIPSLPEPRTGFYTAFLNASGRVLHDVFVYSAPKGAGFLIEVDTDEVDRLASHLKRFKLRAKIEVRVVENGELHVWSIWGHHTSQSNPFKHTEIGCEDTRAPGMGWRAVLKGKDKPGDEEDETSVGSYSVRRMLLGVAEGQGEIARESAFPLESNIDYMSGIDFRKGCYVGQELTIRTHHTGVVRKRILPVQIYPSDAGVVSLETVTYDPDTASKPITLPPRGTNILGTLPKVRSVGKWLAGVGNVGLALCRLELMTDIVLTGGGNSWNPNQKCMASWVANVGEDVGEVMVKAVVPSWMRDKVLRGGTQRV